MREYAIIVAGGKGARMGSDIPKQFLPIGGKPILMRTLEAFHQYNAAMTLILVLPVSQQSYWKELCQAHSFSLSYILADGGETRFHSVRNGLACIPDTEVALVAVHDGVRPFVSQSVIAECFRQAAKKRAVVPVVPVVDTLRRLTADDSDTVDRTLYRLVQTPQVFQLRLLKEAYAQVYTSSFTDDASVVEAQGTPVFLVEGNRENIKITTPFDMKVANALLNG